jgi:hypothetical protein
MVRMSGEMLEFLYKEMLEKTYVSVFERRIYIGIREYNQRSREMKSKIIAQSKKGDELYAIVNKKLISTMFIRSKLRG